MERLNLPGAAEWTVECNPATVSRWTRPGCSATAGSTGFRWGCNRSTRRCWTGWGACTVARWSFESFDILRRAGFDNLNLDLMFAIPGQSLELWEATLAEALALGSEHLSSYEVIYEEDTPLFAQLQAGEVDVDEDLACAMYETLVDRAGGAGFHQYEIANFARDETRVKKGEPRASSLEPRTTKVDYPGLEIQLSVKQHSDPPSLTADPPHLTPDTSHLAPLFSCRHNVNYWRGGSFYGLGPSATTYVRGVRTRNRANITWYCEQLESGRRAIESSEELAPLARAGETAAFGLRMVAGWPFEEFRCVTGYDLRNEWAGDMNRLVEQSWGRISPDRFQLTHQGLRFADAAAELFLR